MTNSDKQDDALNRILAEYNLGPILLRSYTDENVATLMTDPRAVKAKDAIQQLIERETCSERDRVVRMFVGEVSTPDLKELIEVTRPVAELHKRLVDLPRDKRHRARLIKRYTDVQSDDLSNPTKKEGELMSKKLNYE